MFFIILLGFESSEDLLACTAQQISGAGVARVLATTPH